MSTAHRHQELQAMLTTAPLDALSQVWRTVPKEDRLWFLVKFLTREERQALALTFAEDLPWLFAQGQVVRWADEGGTVVQQRVTFRDVMGPVFEYLVQPPRGLAQWVCEADLTPVEEDPCPS